MIRRLAVCALLVLGVTGCSFRHNRDEIREMPDGVKVYCTWTENGISGNQSDQRCVALP